MSELIAYFSYELEIPVKARRDETKSAGKISTGRESAYGRCENMVRHVARNEIAREQGREALVEEARRDQNAGEIALLVEDLVKRRGILGQRLDLCNVTLLHGPLPPNGLALIRAAQRRRCTEL